MVWALGVFVVAGVTDLLDGLIARLGRQQTTLGAMLDPVADKVLLASSFVALTWGPGLPVRIPAWLTVVDAVPRRDHHDERGRREPRPWAGGSSTPRCWASCRTVEPAPHRRLRAARERPRRLPARRGCDWLFACALVLTVASALHYVYLATVRQGRRHDRGGLRATARPAASPSRSRVDTSRARSRATSRTARCAAGPWRSTSSRSRARCCR